MRNKQLMDDDVVLYVNVYQALDFMKKEYGFAFEKRDKNCCSTNQSLNLMEVNIRANKALTSNSVLQQIR